ncbi:MAG: sigma-70 family RNA polymerase sigma factor [Anaeromyxobacter sp.]
MSPSSLERRVRALLAAGEPDAATTTVLRELGPGVLGYLLAVLPGDDGLDVYSAFEVDVWRGLPGFRWESSLRGWAYRIATHAASRALRGAYRRRRQSLPTSFASRAAAPGATASDPGGRKERLARLRERLSPEERTLLVLRVDRELDWVEVAAALAAGGKPAGIAALRKRFERLKDRLRVLAERELAEEAAGA